MKKEELVRKFYMQKEEERELFWEKPIFLQFFRGKRF